MNTMKKSILAILFLCVVGSMGSNLWAQSSEASSVTNTTTPAAVAPVTPPVNNAMNLEDLNESVIQNVQKRLDESRRSVNQNQNSMRQMARSAVYGIVAILFVVFAIFNKRKSKRRRK